MGWLRSQHRAKTGTPTLIPAQLYEQLARVYRRAGDDDAALKIVIARSQDLRRYGGLRGLRKLTNWLLDVTIKYGYKPLRALYGLAAVFVLTLAIFIFAQQQKDLIVPSQATTSLHPLPNAHNCTDKYPCFYPVGFAIDTGHSPHCRSLATPD
jgi:hypothetical protein